MDIGPHPHTGLQTVTWLLAGEVLHRDSLGSEQLIRPGQLNLMTAGHGVSHAEERTGTYRGELHGAQLWIAQPEATRHGEPAFEHHADLPSSTSSAGTATVSWAARTARRHRPGATPSTSASSSRCGRDGRRCPLHADWEYALVVLDGSVTVDGTRVEPGHLAFLGSGHDECPLTADEDATVLSSVACPSTSRSSCGGTSSPAPARDRRGHVRSGRPTTAGSAPSTPTLPRIPVGPPPWNG